MPGHRLTICAPTNKLLNLCAVRFVVVSGAHRDRDSPLGVNERAPVLGISVPKFDPVVTAAEHDH
jgi:hypothetical protein